MHLKEDAVFSRDVTGQLVFKRSRDVDLVASVAVLWGRYIQLHTLRSLHATHVDLTTISAFHNTENGTNPPTMSSFDLFTPTVSDDKPTALYRIVMTSPVKNPDPLRGQQALTFSICSSFSHSS